MSKQAIMGQVQDAAEMVQSALEGYAATHDARYLERLQFWLKAGRYWADQLLQEE